LSRSSKQRRSNFNRRTIATRNDGERRRGEQSESGRFAARKKAENKGMMARKEIRLAVYLTKSKSLQGYLFQVLRTFWIASYSS